MRAVLLDLDDTLLDSSGEVDASWAGACAAQAPAAGIDPAALLETVTAVRAWFWVDPEHARRERLDMLAAWRHIVEHALARLGREAGDLAAAVAEDFAGRRRATLRLFPDALPCLERLRGHGIPLALVTNGDARQQRDKIERFELASFFDAILIEGEQGAGKPEAVVYERALAALRAKPAEAWMIGDNLEWDVAAPMRLGLTGVWVDRPRRGLPAAAPVAPHHIVASLADLADPPSASA